MSQLRWFRPLRRLRPGQINHRTHRKVLIVDEAVGVHRRRRHRRRVAGRRPRRARVARHALPHRGPRRRRAAGRVPRQLGRDRPGALRRGRRPLPRPAEAGRRRRAVRAGRVGDRLERRRHAVPHAAAARRAARPDHDRLLRPRRRPRRPALCGRRPRRARSRSCCPGPTPTSGSCSSPAKATYDAAARRAASSIWNFQPSMLHAKVMTVDGLRRQHRLGQPQRPLGRPGRGDQRRRPRRRAGRPARRPLRRGPRAQRPHRARPLAAPGPWQRAAERAVAPVKRFF